MAKNLTDMATYESLMREVFDRIPRWEDRDDGFRVPRSRAHLVHQVLQDLLLRRIASVLCQPHRLDNVSLRPLEARFAQMMQRAYAYGVNSGTAGLFLALRACGIGPGDEVITVGNSDISTTGAISHCGATPVLCDILETDYTMDNAKVEMLITERTAALLPVDLYGHTADVKSLREIADRYSLSIVEDAALATGACDYGEPVGQFAHVTVFSFGAYKPLGSVGNGGMVVTDDEAIAERLQLLRGYGRPPTNGLNESMYMDHLLEGYNLPLDPLEAVVVSTKLTFLVEWTERRREVATLYAEGLGDLEVGLPSFRSRSEPTFYTYVIQVQDRDAVYRMLRDRDIEVALYYLPPVHRQRAYVGHELGRSRLPVTDKVAERLLCLPVTPELRDSEVLYVVDALREVLRSR